LAGRIYEGYQPAGAQDSSYITVSFLSASQYELNHWPDAAASGSQRQLLSAGTWLVADSSRLYAPNGFSPVQLIDQRTHDTLQYNLRYRAWNYRTGQRNRGRILYLEPVHRAALGQADARLRLYLVPGL
jgi:hypothetical protein